MPTAAPVVSSLKLEIKSKDAASNGCGFVRVRELLVPRVGNPCDPASEQNSLRLWTFADLKDVAAKTSAVSGVMQQGDSTIVRYLLVDFNGKCYARQPSDRYSHVGIAVIIRRPENDFSFYFFAALRSPPNGTGFSNGTGFRYAATSAPLMNCSCDREPFAKASAADFLTLNVITVA